MGAPDQAIAAGQRALALATASGEVVLGALANLFLGLGYQAQGDYRRAIDCCMQTVASLDGARRHERFGLPYLPAVQSRVRLAWCHAELGTFAEGRALGEEGLRIAEAVAHPASLMFAYGGLGRLSLRQGDLPRALSLLERAVAICQDVHLPAYFPRAIQFSNSIPMRASACAGWAANRRQAAAMLVWPAHLKSPMAVLRSAAITCGMLPQRT